MRLERATVGMTSGCCSPRTRTVRAGTDTALVPFSLAYGSFPPATVAFAIPLSTLEPADAFPPPYGYVVGEGVADQWGRVVFPTLLGAGEGAPDQLGSSLLRCVALANANPRGRRRGQRPRSSAQYREGAT